MEDFNSKYSGEQVEQLLDQVASGNAGGGGGGGITVETDPIFSKSPAASITTDKMSSWDNKVDKVSGKQLSTEDFTSALKTKLEGLSNYDDTELSEALSTLRGDFDAIVSGDTTTAIKTFNEIIAFLDGISDSEDLDSIIAGIELQIAGKQAAITDLETIRSGAAAGATAVQPGSLAKVATSGSYNDLDDKPDADVYITPFTVDDLFTGIDFALANPDRYYYLQASIDLIHAVREDKIILIPYRQDPGYLSVIRAWNDGEAVYLTIARETTLIELELGNEYLYHEEIYLTADTIFFEKISYFAEPDTIVKRSDSGGVNATAWHDDTGTTWVTPTSSQDTKEGADYILQEYISDLDDIRDGASKGATAVQPSSLSSVATSGSYNDLSNKPTIPAVVTESTVSGWGFTKNTGTYSKPSGGIPKSDLASAVQTSLGKADTALQSYTEQYKGTITGVSANGTSVATSGVANIPAASTSAYGVTKLSSATNSTSTTLAATPSAVKAAYDLANSYKGTVTGVKINGTTKNPSSGVVDLGTVITSHQDISGKQDKLVSGTNIKTINGASILGSGNITIEGGGGTNQFYITDFTISDLQQLVNGDITEVSANCSALSQALQNNQIIVIPYGLTEDGYFGYSLPDVYYEDLLYMTITDSGSGTVYAIEVDTYSNYIHSDNVSIVKNSNNGAIVQGGSAIDLKIDFDTLYEHYDRNRELDTIELAYTGCVDTLFRELTWDEVESLIRAGTYSFFTTNNFRDEDADRISCPVVVGYDAQGGIKSLHIYSQAADMPYHNYNYVITFMTGDGCTITRYRTGGYRQTNMGTSNVFHTLLPNEFYVWDEVTELNITLELAWEDSTLYTYTKEYVFQFTSGSEPTTLSLPESIKWSNGEAPVIEANKIYQISILNGLGTVMSWDNSNLISFSIMWGVSSVLNFECEKDMTWEAFVASSYNTDSMLKISNGNIWYSSYRIEDATPTSIIENGKIYTSIYDD